MYLHIDFIGLFVFLYIFSAEYIWQSIKQSNLVNFFTLLTFLSLRVIIEKNSTVTALLRWLQCLKNQRSIMNLVKRIITHVKDSFRSLSRFELILWIVSAVTVTVSFFCSADRDPFVLAASLIEVTALIFIAKGNVLGQILIIIFSLLYGYVSFKQAYYGELITYIFMSGGIAVFATISWIRHPYKEHSVKIAKLRAMDFVGIGILTLVVTVAFYFILGYFNTNNLIVSTLSVATSFAASMLTVRRSPLYALAYTLNDVVLIVLWICSAISDPSSIPMVACFTIFLLNDVYGFVNWLRMQKEQAK